MLGEPRPVDGVEQSGGDIAPEEPQVGGGCPIGSLASEIADSDPEARKELVAGFARWEGAIRDGLMAMRDRGELRPEADPARLALAMLAALQGGLLLAQTRRDTVALEAALDTTLECIRAYAP